MGMGELRKKKIYIDQINFGDDSQNGTKNDFNKETRKEKKKKCANGEAESYMERNKKKAAKVI